MADNSGFKRMFTSMQSGVQSGISSVQSTITGMRQGSSTFYSTAQQNQKSVKNGWLTKKGGMVKSWHRRWFTVKGDYMYYFANEDESKQPLGSIFLPGNKVVEHPFNTSEPDKFLFEVIPGNDMKMSATHETYPLCAISAEERRDWIQAIRQVMYAEKGGAIFGQRLANTLLYERRLENNPSRKIPQIVELCVDYIIENGLSIEGIFRLPGRSTLVRDLREKFDCGERPDFDTIDMDIHSVASLLKAYLRELPEPLIPCDFYERVMKIVMRDMNLDPDNAVESLAKVMEDIPQENYNVLQYVCKFLKEVSNYSEENKMTIMNLATVFAQSFISPEDDDPALLMGTASGRTQVVFVLVTCHETVFKLEYTAQGNSLMIDNLLDLGNGDSSASEVTQDGNLPHANSYESELAGLFGSQGDVPETGAPVRPARKAPKAPPRPPSPKISREKSEDSVTRRERLYPSLSRDLEAVSPDDVTEESIAEQCKIWPRQGSVKSHRGHYILEQDVADRESADTEDDEEAKNSISSDKTSSMPRNEELPPAEESSPVAVQTPKTPQIPPRPKRTSSVPSDSSSMNGVTTEEEEFDDDAFDRLVSTDVSGFSADDLQAHVRTLCSELKSLRTKLKETKASLKSTSHRHREQINSMAQTMDTEKRATANAVERIMSLNSQLQAYSMKYGPLQ